MHLVIFNMYSYLQKEKDKKSTSKTAQSNRISAVTVPKQGIFIKCFKIITQLHEKKRQQKIQLTIQFTSC